MPEKKLAAGSFGQREKRAGMDSPEMVEIERIGRKLQAAFDCARCMPMNALNGSLVMSKLKVRVA